MAELIDGVLTGEPGEILDANEFAADEVTEIQGSDGDDELIALEGDLVSGFAGDDILDATPGRGGNTLDGGSGNDELFAGENDTLLGGENQDFLVAGRGGSTLTGGPGADIFLITSEELPASVNTITDFNASADLIAVALTDFDSLDDLSITQQGDDTLIGTPGGEDIALLLDTTVDELNEENVIFVEGQVPFTVLPNEAPTVEDETFNVDPADVADGFSVGTLVTADNEDDTLTFAITDGNVDGDGDGTEAFGIDAATGEITITDADDVSEGTFSLSVSVDDNNNDPVTGTATVVVGTPPQEVNYDIDGNGVIDAGTDGGLLFRLISGIPVGLAKDNDTDPNNGFGFLADDATITTDAELQAAFDSLINANALDIDGNGVVDAGTDGGLIFRLISGIPVGLAKDNDTDPNNGFGFLADDATRTTDAELQAFFDQSLI